MRNKLLHQQLSREASAVATSYLLHLPNEDTMPQEKETAAEGNASICSRASKQSLRALVISSNSLGSSAALAFAALLETGCTLQRVELCHNPLGALGLFVLSKAIASLCDDIQKECDRLCILRDISVWPVLGHTICPSHTPVEEESLSDTALTFKAASSSLLQQQHRFWCIWNRFEPLEASNSCKMIMNISL